MMQHKAELVGREAKKRYRFDIGFWGNSSKVNAYEIDRNPSTIWEGFLDNPVLEKNELIYVDVETGSVKVIEVQRSTKGGYRYIVNYVKWIEDDKTFISKGEAEEKLKRHEEEMKKEYKSYRICTEAESPDRKWYQFWK